MSALSCLAQMSAHVKLQRKQPFDLSELDGAAAAIRLDFLIFPDFYRFNSLGPIFDPD